MQKWLDVQNSADDNIGHVFVYVCRWGLQGDGVLQVPCACEA